MKNAIGERINKEYNDFIEYVRREGVDYAIERCYEITIKRDIHQYATSVLDCNSSFNPEKDKRMYELYESCKENTLHELFRLWCDSDEYESFSDIGYLIKDFANIIEESQYRSH